MSWSIWLGSYFYICWCFGFWYYYRKWKPKAGYDNFPEGAAFFVSLVTSWWFWPLMIVYLLTEVAEKRKKNQAELREQAHRRSERWGSDGPGTNC